MKNHPFCHSESPVHSLRKWMAFSLFAFAAVLAGIHANATPTLSRNDTLTTSSSGKSKPGKKRPIRTTRALSAQTVPEKNTIIHHWHELQPFTQTNALSSGNNATGKETAAIFRTTDSWHHLVMTSSTDGTGHSVRRTSGIFSGKNPDHTVMPAKMAFTDSDRQTSPDRAAELTGTPENRGYTIGPARFTVNYEKANDRAPEKMSRYLTGNATYDMAGNDIVESRTDRDNFRLGMEYDTGNGRINAAVNVVRMKDLKKVSAERDNPDSMDLKTFMIGYTYDISDKTSFYGMIARTEYEKEAVAAFMHGNGTDDDNITGFQFGMTHRF